MPEAPPQPEAQLALVAGFGPVGRLVAEGLAASGYRVMVLETNPATVTRQQKLGRNICLADARDPDALARAGLIEAHLLVLTMPDEADAVAACSAARSIDPQVQIIARTNFASQGLLARQLGADHVVVEELVTAEAMRDAVLSFTRPDSPPSA
jgi:CPA2 family monovalent cation:H+ antiporter-2